MPELDISKVSSPVDTKEYARPQYGAQYQFEELGSKDTALSRFMGDYYDASFVPTVSQADQRYNNTSWKGGIINGVGSLALKTVSGLPSMIGGVQTLVSLPFTSKDDLPEVMANPLTTLGRAISEAGSEYFPQFQEDDFAKMSFFQQLTQKPNQLFTQNIDSVAFALQSVIGGAGLAKLGIGAAMARMLSTTRIAPLIANSRITLTGTASLLDGLATNAVLTTNESVMEAQDAYKQVKESLIRDRVDGKNNLTDDEIEEKATNSNYNVFWENMITAGVTNGIFLKLLRPLNKFKKTSTAGNKFDLVASKSGDSIVAPPTMTKFEKLFSDKGSALGMGIKGTAGQMVTEFAEESLQYSIQKINEAANVKDSLWESLKDYGAMLPKTFDVTDEERFKAGALGALMGGVSTAASHPFGGGPVNEARDFAKAQKEYVDAMNASYTNFVGASIAAKTPAKNGRLYEKDGKFFNEEEGGTAEEISAFNFEKLTQDLKANEQGAYTIPSKFKVTPDGDIEIDPIKQAQFAAAAKVDATLQDYIDNEASAQRTDPLKLKLYRNEQLNNLANTAFKAGAADVIVEKFEGMKGSKEAMETMGLTREELDSHIDETVKYIRGLEEKFFQIENNTIDYVQNARAHAGRKALLHQTAARLMNLDSAIDFNRRQTESAASGFLAGFAEQDDKVKLTKTLTTMANVIATEDNLQSLFAERESAENLSQAEMAKLDEKISKAAKELKKIVEVSAEQINEVTDLAGESEILDIARLMANDKLLNKSRAEIQKYFDQMFDMKKGRVNFKYNAKKLLPIQNRMGLILPIGDKLSLEEYEFYEQRKIRQKEYTSRTRNSAKEYYSFMVNEFITFLRLENPSVETSQSIVTFVQKLLNTKPLLLPDQIERLIQEIDTYVGNVLSTKTDLENEYDQLAASEELTTDQIDRLGELDDLIQDMEYIANSLGDLIVKRDEMYERLRELGTFIAPSVSQASLEKEVRDEMVMPFEATVQNAKFDGTDIDPSYDELAKVESQIKAATRLKEKVFSQATKFAEHDARLTAVIASLEKIAELIKANRLNREKRDKMQNGIYATSLLETVNLKVADSLFSLAFKEKFGVPSYSALKVVSETDPVLASSIVMEAMSFFTPKQREDILGQIKDKLKTALMSDAVLSQEFGSQAFDAEFADAALQSPIRVFKAVFEMYNLKASIYNATLDTSALELFLKDYDIVNLKSAQLDPGTKTLVDNYLQAVGLFNLQNNTASRQHHTAALTMLQENQKAINAGLKFIPPVTEAQFKTAGELSAFVQAPLNRRNELFDNVAIMKAPAGAGKTTVVTPLMQASAGLSSEEMFVAGGTTISAEVINDAVKSPYPVTTTEGVVKHLTERTLPEGVKLIVLDEAGSLNYPDVHALTAALVSFNAANPHRAVKLMFIYDPNQTTVGNLGQAVFDTSTYSTFENNKGYSLGDEAVKKEYRQGKHFFKEGKHNTAFMSSLPLIQNVTEVTPLSSTFRSNVSEIVELQNSFKTESQIVTINTATNSTTAQGQLGTAASTSSEQLLNAALQSAKANPSRSRLIIVGNNDKKGRAQGFVDTHQLPHTRVLTAEEAKGLTVDEVFVDIQVFDHSNLNPVQDNYGTYNQSMYTAISRAKLYANVAHYSSNHTVDSTINDRVKDNTTDFTQKFKDTIALKQEQLKTFTSILGEEEVKKEAAPAAKTKEPVKEETATKKKETPKKEAEPPSSDKEKDPEFARQEELIIKANTYRRADVEVVLPAGTPIFGGKVADGVEAFIRVDEVLLQSGKLREGDNITFLSEKYRTGKVEKGGIVTADGARWGIQGILTNTDNWIRNETMIAEQLAELKERMSPKKATQEEREEYDDERFYDSFDTWSSMLEYLLGLSDSDLKKTAKRFYELDKKQWEETFDDSDIQAILAGDRAYIQELINEFTNEEETDEESQTNQDRENEDMEETLEEELDNTETLGADDLPAPQGATGVNDGSVHVLEFPQTDLFKDNNKLPKLEGGESVILAKDTSNGKQRIMVLQPLGSTGSYRKIGVLSDGEVIKLSGVLGKNLMDLQGHSFTPDNAISSKNAVRIVGGGQVTSFIPARIAYNSNGIIYQYDNNPTIDFSNEGDIKGLLDKYLKQLFGEDPSKRISNYKDIINNPEKYVKILKFNTPAQVAAAFPNASEHDRPKMHRPYLIIKGIQIKNGGEMKPQFIALTSAVLTKDNENVQMIQSFTEQLGDFETMLGVHASKWAGMYGALQSGKPVVVANQSYYPFHNLVVQLSELYRKKIAGTLPEEATLTITSEQNQAVGPLFPPVPFENIPEELLQAAYELDIAVHGREIGSPEATKRRSYTGPVQKAFDKIATQNFIVTLPSGKNLILRDYYSVRTEGNEQTEQLTGASLLGPIKFEDARHGIAYNPYIKKSLRDALNSYYGRLQQRGATDSSRGRFVNEILAAEKASIPPISLQDLQELFRISVDQDGKLSNVSEGFGLRAPIYNYKFSEAFYTGNKRSVNEETGEVEMVNDPKTINDLDLNGVVVSHFNRVIPMTVGITLGDEAGSLEAPVTDSDPVMISELNKLRKLLREMMDYSFKENQPIPETLAAMKREVLKSPAAVEFTTALNAPSLEQGLADMLTADRGPKIISKISNTIMRQLKSMAKSTDARIDMMIKAIKTSASVVDIGRNAGGYAASDFIRGAIYLQLFPEMGINSMMSVLDFARGFYLSDESRRADEYADRIPEMHLKHAALTELFISDYVPGNTLEEKQAEFARRLSLLADDFTEAYKALGMTAVIQYPNQIDAFELLPIVDQIVDASGRYRRGERQQQAANPAPVPSIDDAYISWMSAVKQALDADNDTAAINLLESQNNKPHLVKLLSYVGKTKLDLDTVYEDIEKALGDSQLERSMIMEDEDQDIGQLVTEEEAHEIARKLSPPSLLTQLKEAFFGKASPEVVRIVDFAYMQHALGRNNWGLYRDGIISIARHKSGKVGTKIVRHEIFHKIFHEYLAKEEQLHVLALAQSAYNISDPILLEERMAEDFSNFNSTRKAPSALRKFFNALLRFFGFTYNNFNSLDSLFESIQAGMLTPKNKAPNLERSMMFIATAYDSVEAFRVAKAKFFETFEEVLKIKEQELLTFDEVVEKSFTALNAFNDKFEAETTEEKILKSGLNTLLTDRKAKAGFINEYFGQTSLLTANLIRSMEKYDERMGELQEHMDKLEQLRVEDQLPDEVQEEWDDLMQEMEGLYEETFDSELRDPKTKLTGRLKQRLVTIKTWKDGKMQFAEPALVYDTLLTLVNQIDNSSIQNALTSLTSRLSLYASTDERRRTVKEATGAHLLHLVNRISDLVHPDSNIREDITFRLDTQHEGMYAIISNDGSSTEEISVYEARRNPKKYKIEFFEMMLNTETGKTYPEPLSRFASRIASSTEGFDIKTIGEAYYKFEDINFFRTLIATVGSLRAAQPHVGLQQWKWGDYRSVYFRNRFGGGKHAAESQVISAFDDYVTKLESNKYLFDKTFMERLFRANTIVDKRTSIKEFLYSIKMDKYSALVDDFSQEDVAEVFGKMRLALSSMQEKYEDEFDPTVELYEEYEFSRQGHQLLSNESSFISVLVSALNSHIDVAANNSYVRADGKRAYGYQDASYQSSVLNTMASKVGAVRHKNFVKENGVLKTTNEFLKNNIFFNGVSKVFGYVDHDGLKTKGKDQYAIYLRREKRPDFHRRNITHGFLGHLYRKQADGIRKYIQFLPSPANRTTVEGVEVNVLYKNQIPKAIRTILTGQANRPNPEQFNDAKYSKTWQKVSFPGVETTAAQFNKNPEKYIKQSEAFIKKRAKQLALEMVPMDATRLPNIDFRHLEAVAKLFGVGTRSYNVNHKTFTQNRRDMINDGKDVTALNNERLAAIREVLENILEIYYGNYVVNQYSLSQILYGDESFYGSKEALTKRIHSATATGDTMLIDQKYGLPPTSKVLVVKDIRALVDTSLPGARADSFGEDYAVTDGEGFMLPEFYEKIAKTYGIEANADVVLKPVYFAPNENGQPRIIKYSVKVLTDELCAKFPHLSQYRDEMRRQGTDQMVFESAIKVGLPATAAKILPTGQLDTDTTGAATMTINNQFLRFQLNPAKSPEITVSNPSQITAFVDTNSQNPAEHHRLMQLNGILIKEGLRNLMRELRITRKGTMTGASEKLVREKLLKSLEGLPNALDIYNLLSHKDSEGNYDVPLSVPMIAEKAVSSIASMFSKSTVGFRFPGSKLVLQAEVGTTEYYDDQGNLQKGNLAWKTAPEYDENGVMTDPGGYTEVFLPESYRDTLSVGDVIVQNAMMAFRIPSTNYHSAIAFKIKGFYPSPPGSEGNLVIAPSPIVYYHGSDYDVDTLFVLRKNVSQRGYNLKTYISEELQDIAAGDIIGFNKDGSKTTVNGLPLYNYLENKLNQLHMEAAAVANKIHTAPIRKRLEYKHEIALINHKIEMATEVLMEATKNEIVDLLTSNIREMRNRTDLLTPITFSSVSKIKEKTREELLSLLSDKVPEKTAEFLADLEKAGFIKIECPV